MFYSIFFVSFLIENQRPKAPEQSLELFMERYEKVSKEKALRKSKQAKKMNESRRSSNLEYGMV